MEIVPEIRIKRVFIDTSYRNKEVTLTYVLRNDSRVSRVVVLEPEIFGEGKSALKIEPVWRPLEMICLDRNGLIPSMVLLKTSESWCQSRASTVSGVTSTGWTLVPAEGITYGLPLASVRRLVRVPALKRGWSNVSFASVKKRLGKGGMSSK